MTYEEVVKLLDTIQNNFIKNIDSVKLIVKGYCSAGEDIKQLGEMQNGRK